MIFTWGKKTIPIDALRRDISDQLAGTGIILETLSQTRSTVTLILTAPEYTPEKLQQIQNDLRHIIMTKYRAGSAKIVITSEKRVETPTTQALPSDQPPPPPAPLGEHIKSIIAVASGKGGVGKSTVAVNLAVALAQSGLSVGVLDADIYGPSIPTMMGIAGQRPKRDDHNKIIPVTAHGVTCMSMGLFTDPAAGAVVWRGPMIQSAIIQMIRDVDWAGPAGVLDVLVIDMPPGTGDAHMAVAQKLNLAGAIIVSTPQDVALIDAEKAVQAFQKLGVPILGLVENMSIFCCPHCGHDTAIFGANGARDAATRWEIPFLGALPIDMGVRTAGDTGTPIVGQPGEQKTSVIYRKIITLIQTKLFSETTKKDKIKP